MNQQRSLDWNYTRRSTRDLLLEYDSVIMPPRPRAAGLAMVYPWLNSNGEDQGWIGIPPIPDTPEFKVIYPWESVGLNILGDQIYLLASRSGYIGTREEFHRYFGSYLNQNKWEILFDNFTNFPATGEIDKLYFDLTENILYYWADGQYLPVNAMLITNTILEGGEA